jgi:hypothetical protein
VAEAIDAPFEISLSSSPPWDKGFWNIDLDDPR